MLSSIFLSICMLEREEREREREKERERERETESVWFLSKTAFTWARIFVSLAQTTDGTALSLSLSPDLRDAFPKLSPPVTLPHIMEGAEFPQFFLPNLHLLVFSASFGHCWPDCHGRTLELFDLPTGRRQTRNSLSADGPMKCSFAGFSIWSRIRSIESRIRPIESRI